MSMRKTYSRVQSFPSPEAAIPSSPLSNQFDQSFVSKLNNLQQLQGCRISAEHLYKILDASVLAQKMGKRTAIDSAACSNSDWKFINCFLESTVLLLDSCNNVQLRLQSIKSCLHLIPIGLHYLEGEHEPSKAVLQRAAAALESSRFKEQSRHCSKMSKRMSRMKTFSKKLSNKLAYQITDGDSISPELYKGLSGSWIMAFLAVEVLNSATSSTSLTGQCVQPPKAEPWTTILNELSYKIRATPKKTDESSSMEELASVDLAAQALLNLISTWQSEGNSSLRRITVKAVARELRRRKEELEKKLSLLEEKIGELYKQIVALRINLFELLSKAQKEEVVEMVRHSRREESQVGNINIAQYQRCVAWVKVKTKVIERSCSLSRKYF